MSLSDRTRPISFVWCDRHGSFKVTGAIPPAPCPICLWYGTRPPWWRRLANRLGLTGKDS